MEWSNPFSSLTERQCGTLPQHEVVETPPPINPYDILHLRRDATTSEIRKAFRRLGLLNHPGRTCLDKEQQLRRIQLFDLLSAAYETLVDKESRQRYDLHLSSVENLKYTRGLAGEMFVGGKRLGSNVHEIFPPKAHTPKGEPEVIVPELVRSDSASSFSSLQSGDTLGTSILSNMNNEIEMEITFESIEVDSLGRQIQEVSEEEKQRILGGPLKDLFNARNCVAFSDSLVVFEEVFGSKVFDISHKPVTQPPTWDQIKNLSYPSGWEGSSKISPDGRTRVFTTSRILYDKRVTRIETFTDDPMTGTRTKSTTVTSEPIGQDAVEEEIQTCFTICTGCRTLERSDDDPSSSFCKDLLQSYYEICSQLYDEFRNMGLGYFHMIY